MSAQAMILAGVSIAAEDADALLARFKAVTALRGEMKGSRISLVERALFFELLERYGGRAIICQVRVDRLPAALAEAQGRDLHASGAGRYRGIARDLWANAAGGQPTLGWRADRGCRGQQLLQSGL